MNIIEKLEELHSDLVALIGNIDEVKRLRAIIEEYKKQEPVAYQFLDNGKWYDFIDDRHKENTIAAGYEVRPLFTHPPLSDETVKDAERYRWLRDKSTSHKHHSPTVTLMDGYGIKVRYGFHGDPKCQPYMTLSNEIMDSVIDEAMKAYK